MSVPATLDDVSAEWLADALHLPVASAALEVIGRGEGFLGQLGRVTLGYTGGARPDDAPASVIVKLPTLDPGGRAVGMMMGVWERESRFYAELAASMQVRVPKAHVNISSGGEYALVLEDLAPLRPADQVAGASPDQARRVIDELSKMHGAWWDSPALREAAWLPGLDSPLPATIKPMFDAGWPQFRARYGDRLPARALAWAEAFSDRMPEVIARYLADPVTLVHGDFRLDNMFFDADGSPEGEFALVDWQMSMRSPGGSDLVYFIVTNLTTETRRAMERELVTRYCDGLRRAGVTGSYATTERLWQGYLEGVCFYAVTFGGGLLGIDTANERGTRLFDELVLRTYTALDDLAAGDALGLS